jgi:adsorption protein B
VDKVAKTSSSVRKVVVPHDGPTSKADCLNWIYQGILLEEQRRGERFDILAMHDAEDVIHPLMLRLYGILIPPYEFVQTPVFSLPLAARQVVAGTYIDEFAEHHLKDMLVRQAIGGLIPSAGVGSAFDRDAFEEMARRHGQTPFNTESLTEDYEIGLKFRLANRKVTFACRTLSVEKGAPEEYIATREYFPDALSASIRQRSRWICGIALQTWRQIGWKGSLPVLYCLWRDRKAIVTNTLLSLAYALILYFLARTLMAVFLHSGWDYREVVPSHSVLSAVLAVNLWMLIWRFWVKGSLVHRLYGSWQGVLSVPRLVLGNVISLSAMTRAVFQYAHHRWTGKPLRWLKTAHAFPSVDLLREQEVAHAVPAVAEAALVRADVVPSAAGDRTMSLSSVISTPSGGIR